MNKDELYISFLEAMNKAQDLEFLYESAFQIIKKIFNASRVQIWEKLENINEMSISYEYFEGNETSLIKFRAPLLEDRFKKTFENTNVWEYVKITDIFFTRNNIKSLCGIEINLEEKNKSILVLTSKEENKKLTADELAFLTKIKTQLEYSISKVKKYQKNSIDLVSLQNQNSKLREQDRLRTNFINNISHELRTPLASILGFTKILINKNLSLETIKEMAEQIHEAGNRLSKLITDFLQINKIDTEGWLAHYEPCDLGEIIREAVEEFSSLNKNYSISYTLSDDYPIIKADPKLVRQVLDNLLSNAIKYSPGKG